MLITSVTVAVRVSPPPVPVIVSVNVPAGVVETVFTVKVEDVPVTGFGLLNVPVAPDGNPLTDRSTLVEKPPLFAIVTVYVVLPPRVTVRDAGDADSVKFGVAGALTTSVTVVACVSAPLVPVIVTVNVPVGVAAPVVTVIVDEPDPGTDVGLKLADAPAGSPLALNDTSPLKPPDGVTVAV